MSTNEPENNHDPGNTAYPETLDELRQRIAMLEVHKPKGWAANSVSPYYTASFGEQVKTIIEALYADREQDIVLDTRTHSVSVSTAKAQFYQGWAWLRERHPDPEVRERFMKIFLDKQIFTQVVGRKIRFYIKELTTTELLASIQKVKSYNSKTVIKDTWRTRLSEWLDKEHKEMDILRISDERLSPDDLEYIDILISGLEDYIITTRKASCVEIVYMPTGPAPTTT